MRPQAQGEGRHLGPATRSQRRRHRPAATAAVLLQTVFPRGRGLATRRTNTQTSATRSYLMHFKTSIHNTFIHMILINFSRPNFFYQLSAFSLNYLIRSVREAVLHTVHLTNNNAFPPRKQNQYEGSIFIRKASLPPCGEARGCCGLARPRTSLSEN